jgi:hypothetical protein
MALALSCLLLPQAIVPAFSFGKKPLFQMPLIGKLGPNAPAADGSLTQINQPINLAPVTLDQSGAPTTDTQAEGATTSTQVTATPVTGGDASNNQAASAQAANGNQAASGGTQASGGAVLKSTLTETDFVPNKTQDAQVPGESVSVIKPKQTTGIEQAKSVNVMPLPLMESADEASKKIDTAREQEKKELADLWEATLSRSPDIQFVVQKLMPSSDPNRTSAIMMKLLSSAMFGAMGAANMMVPNMGMYAANSMGASMMMNLMGAQEGKNAKKAKLSQEEAIMLYNMVRKTADGLVDNFRSYKKNILNLNRADMDLDDLKNMVADARAGQDAAKQVEMEYTLRKQERDVDAITDEVKQHRQSLIDIAGNDAVVKLDQQLDDEQVKIAQQTGQSTDGAAGEQTASDAPGQPATITASDKPASAKTVADNSSKAADGDKTSDDKAKVAAGDADKAGDDKTDGAKKKSLLHKLNPFHKDVETAQKKDDAGNAPQTAATDASKQL